MDYILDVWNAVTGFGASFLEPSTWVLATFVFFFIICPILIVWGLVKFVIWFFREIRKD